MLAQLRRKRPLELMADFQQFYNLDIDDIGHGLRPRRAGDLAAMLPPESRCVRAESDGRTDTDSVLMLIEWWTHQLWWAMTEDGQKNRNHPKPLFSTEEEARPAMTADQMRETLSKKRKNVTPGKEVGNGN